MSFSAGFGNLHTNKHYHVYKNIFEFCPVLYVVVFCGRRMPNISLSVILSAAAVVSISSILIAAVL
jgi:hypothetical protein